MKEQLKNILAKLNRRWIKVPLIIMCIIILVAGLVLEIFDNVADTFTTVSSNLEEYYEVQNDGAIVISDERIDEIIQELDSLHVGGVTAWNLEGNLSDYEGTSEEKKEQAAREYLRKFCEAQAVTETLNYNKTEDPEKTYGRVYVSRVGEEDEDTTNARTLTYIPYEEMLQKQQNGGSSSGGSYIGTVSALDNFLFIGDSRTVGAKSRLLALANNVSVKAVSSSGPGDWKTVTSTGGPSAVLSTSITLPSKENVKGISIALGANWASEQINEMKEVLNNLLERYPDVPIFVNSVFGVGQNFSAPSHNNSINIFNNAIRDFCNTNSRLIYIDITEGLHNESGYLKTEYAPSDGLHLNAAGNDLLVRNIANAILSYGNEGGSTEEIEIIEPTDADIMDCFSINEEGKIVVAGKVHTLIKENGTVITNSTEITLKTVDYKTIASRYTTKVNFFVFLNMVAQNPEFVTALTELVKDSKIQLTFMDNVTSNYTKETHTYTVNTKTVRQVGLNEVEEDDIIPYELETSTSSRTVTNVIETTVTTTTPSMNVTYAKTWFSEQTVTYTRRDNGPNNAYGQPEQEAEDETEPAGTSPGTYTWITDQTVTIDTSNSSKRFVETTRSDVEDKTGEKGSPGLNTSTKEVDENTTFLGLMDDVFKIPNSSTRRSAAGNLTSGATWLFMIMEKDESLQTSEELMKYIMYKYTGKDYGVTEFDFSIFDSKNFISLGGVGYSFTGSDTIVWRNNYSRDAFVDYVQNYITPAATHNGYTNQSGWDLFYAGHAEEWFDICTSHGIDPIPILSWSINESGWGSSYYARSRGNLWGWGAWDTNPDNASSGVGSTADQKAMYLLEIICGELEETINDPNHTRNLIAIANGYTGTDVTTLEAISYWYCSGAVSWHQTASALMRIIFGDFIAANCVGGDIIGWAETIHAYMEEYEYTYCVYGCNSYEECGRFGKSHGLNRTFEESKTGYHNTCCATYVSWVLQEAGYITSAEHSNGADGIAAAAIRNGWTYVSIAEAQAGDLIYYPNEHIEIYAGNGTKYNAGSGEAIRRDSPYSFGAIPARAKILRAPYTEDTSSDGSGGSGGTEMSPSSATGTRGYLHPCPGLSYISNYPGSHDGYDFAASTGTPVYAVTDGTAQFIQIYNRSSGKLVSYGNYILLTATDGNSIYYAHLNAFKGVTLKIPSTYTERKSASQVSTSSHYLGSRQVRKGELIGYVGNTGYSFGPHLHFEMRRGGSQVNPRSYIPSPH